MPMFNFPVPAIRGKFGNRLWCFQTTIPAKDFKTVLGHDPRGKNWGALGRSDPETAALYEYLQRKTQKDRRDNLMEYIRYRMCPNPLILGAFPAVSIGVTEPAEFKPYTTDEADVGRLLLPNCPRVLLDGLGRVTAAMDLMEESDIKGVGEWFTFPVTFYVPAQTTMTKEELGQLFHDFNFRQVRVALADALSLDQSDLHIRMTSRLGDSDVIQRHGGLAETASLGKKSTELVTQKHLLKFVRGAIEGRNAQDSDKKRIENPRLLPHTFDVYERKLEAYLVRLEELMGSRFADHTSIHLTSGGWQVLGAIFHDVEFLLQLSDADRDKTIQLLAKIDWSRYNPFWIGLLGEAEVDPQSGRPRLARTKSWGRNVKQQLLDYVRTQCGIRDQIAATEPTGELAEESQVEEELVPA